MQCDNITIMTKNKSTGVSRNV